MSKIPGNLAKNFSRLCDQKASFHRRRRKIFTCQQFGTVAFYKHPFLLGSPAKALVPAFTNCQKPISHANSLQGWRITHNGQVLPMVGNFYIRPPGTAARLFDKVEYKERKLGFIRQAPNQSTAELPLLIAPMSSPTIGNTYVVGRFVCRAT